ncbi:F0F1 ATP synthase subunit B [Ligilactobacillus ceti]|uniref:ATP synthase subunit b n=1 Tax=Ligilactobacillus ceti DSM 22408 TaxID=1122146 RepID=A0A0R2KHZ2_9LACO|nr:F0F1 ATP synthase subunit B [Ligilactobacillus ceti]KRN89008.1 ATP synthase F0 sector subunit B [Ligilactobacillus ceti DSM 22408]
MNSTFLLDAQGVQWGDFLFYLVTFLLLIAAIKHFAWDSIAGMMDKRAEKIADDIDSAERNRIKAAELAEQREAALKDSHIEASQIVDRAKKNGEEQKATILASANSEATALKERARKDIEQERQDALEGVKNDVAELSIEIASKVIQKELNASGHETLVDSYIEGLGKHNETR